MSVLLFLINTNRKMLLMVISQRLNFAISLNRKTPIKDKAQIKTVGKFDRLWFCFQNLIHFIQFLDCHRQFLGGAVN